VRGGAGWTIVAGAGEQRRISGTYVRDEGEQARYLRELLALYEQEGIDAAFWFSFANYDKPRRADPARDLDLASYGVVAVLEPDDGHGAPAWVRKEAFAALAGYPHALSCAHSGPTGTSAESVRRSLRRARS